MKTRLTLLCVIGIIMMSSCRTAVQVDGDIFKKRTEIGSAGMTRSQFVKRNPPAKKTEVYVPVWPGSVPIFYTYHREVHWIDAQSFVEVLYHLVDSPYSGGVDLEGRVDGITLSPNDVIYRLTEVRTTEQLPTYEFPYYKMMQGSYYDVFSAGAKPEIIEIGPVHPLKDTE